MITETELLLVPATDPILRLLAVPVSDFKAAADLAESMKRAMHSHIGVGLAAPQIGVSLRLFVMLDGTTVITCINPSIISHGRDTELAVEGCLSFPMRQVSVKRHRVITVEYLDEETRPIHRTLKGFTARIFQHELDHLNGVCIA